MIFALITQPAFATPDETHKYPAGDKSDPTVHAFLPEKTTRSGKAAIFYFGGGWRVGSPEQFSKFYQKLVKKNEPETLGWLFYSTDPGKISVIERYASPEAAMQQ